MKDHYNVLFLCTGNSARSIIAEAILNREGRGKFKAFSAGSHPKARSIRARSICCANSTTTSRRCARNPGPNSRKPGAPELDFVFTVCDNAAGEACPLWPGQPITAHWGIPDPAAAEGSEAEIALAFKDAYRMLNRRIDLLLALPLEKLDRLVLTTRLKAIGRSEGATEKAQHVDV